MNIVRLIEILPENIWNEINDKDNDGQLSPILYSLGVNNEFRLCHLLGECKEESVGFTKFVEDLNYSASRLIAIFPIHFNGIEDANNYAHNPQKIANRIYSNRMGNGSEESGEGWLYRGRGCVQITGKVNYQQLSHDTGRDYINNPDMIGIGLDSSVLYFKNKGIFEICDKGISNTICELVCRKVNGGILGLQERIQYTNEFYNKLTS